MNEVAALCPSISLSFAVEGCNSLFANLHSDKARVSGSLWKINPRNMSSVEGTVQAYLTLSVYPNRICFRSYYGDTKTNVDYYIRNGQRAASLTRGTDRKG